MGRGTWIRRLVNVLACVALAATGCAGESAAPSSPGVVQLRVAMFGGGSTLPVHAALQKGIFERNGLQIELTEGQDLPVFMAALAKGQYDIVMSGPTLVLIGVEKGLDLQIISSLQRSSQRAAQCGVDHQRASRSIRLANSRERRSAYLPLPGSSPIQPITC